MQKFTQYSPAEKKSKTEVEQTDVKGDGSGEAELKQNVDNLNKSIKYDHDCIYVCDCVENCIAQDALRNRKLLIDCSWNWKASKPKMLFFEDKQQREGMLWISF